MFETSVVRVRAAAAPRRVGLLTASIAFHSLVIIGAVAVTISSVSFPKTAPKVAEIFRPFQAVALPPALGNPQAPRPRTPQPPAPAHPAPATPAVTAPPVVPDTVTPAAASTSTAPDTSASAAATGTGGSDAVGVPNGVPGGFGIGTGDPVGGTGDTIMRMGVGVTAPVVITRVDPVYPPLAVKVHMNGTVIVECIIGKNGVCREPHVVMSTSPMFNQSAIDAVERWRFRPGVYRDQPVDTYFDLTIKFQLN